LHKRFDFLSKKIHSTFPTNPFVFFLFFFRRTDTAVKNRFHCKLKVIMRKASKKIPRVTKSRKRTRPFRDSESDNAEIFDDDASDINSPDHESAAMVPRASPKEGASASFLPSDQSDSPAEGFPSKRYGTRTIRRKPKMFRVENSDSESEDEHHQFRCPKEDISEKHVKACLWQLASISEMVTTAQYAPAVLPEQRCVLPPITSLLNSLM
jgi:hypothetical protein